MNIPDEIIERAIQVQWDFDSTEDKRQYSWALTKKNNPHIADFQRRRMRATLEAVINHLPRRKSYNSDYGPDYGPNMDPPAMDMNG